MKKRYLFLFSIALALIISACSPLSLRDTVTQASTINALLAGNYDGSMTCRKLLSYGDLGIGTFDHLDGEMVILDGRVYQIRADGKVYRPPLDMTTPFAEVCDFCPDQTVVFNRDMDYKGVCKRLDQMLPNRNLFYAIKITGTFSRMRTRSVPAQHKPYLPLARVTSHQSEFLMKNISGEIVGFRCPDYIKGIGVPGYHLHFISDDRSKGGHILDFEMAEGHGAVHVCHRLLLILPHGKGMFGQVDLSKDRSKDLEKVEKQ